MRPTRGAVGDTLPYDRSIHHTRRNNISEFLSDYRNRLTRVVIKDSEGTVIKQVDDTYDAFDKRIGRAVDPDGEGPQVGSEAAGAGNRRPLSLRHIPFPKD